ncbi:MULTISPECIES: BlaI/MecI/CopY family transcriptional regulator [Janthinobacterium]|uniref:BlaI/MecI/CopY family transcriptional regulator n=1 Tax=Janthinobacterium kumbetense TaxID=2950280 RepID=A0ABT0WTS0_9BURK|nr:MULTISPECIES: BlaI/MecI/CopY family transcriptional regulator [Janthinobacterium]MCM2566869.1 BlaI/MecI/CopY family transcriptional regulator [Janthinobacterium kumbetense]MDN2680076.1 BlaI/MecI/CopY family transcriptional regulator [Janthinobacterium sp. SUN033]MDO8068539.1 BlaI/MecI/CopY family transcriptional regulator [Janthinobacterium sp. SUN206]MED5615015.1 BlaI/MecI/CopY family transcriptional regulator [Janthinobacterium sp. P210005]
MKKNPVSTTGADMRGLEDLAPRERQVVECVYRLQEATASQIQEALGPDLSNSAVRAMLARLETKGVLQHRVDGQRYLYSAVAPQAQVRESALKKLVGTFFNNSKASAATALLGMSGELSAKELDDLEAMIAKARQEGC